MKAVDSKISSFIGNSDRVFIIPPFQRNYAWSINQCEELFSDIVDSYNKKIVTILEILYIMKA